MLIFDMYFRFVTTNVYMYSPAYITVTTFGLKIGSELVTDADLLRDWFNIQGDFIAFGDHIYNKREINSIVFKSYEEESEE